MSSFKRLRLLALGCLPALALAGCFTPLYGPNASGPANVSTQLASIELAPLKEAPGQERTAHYLTQELKYLLDGGASQPAAKRYRLSLNLSQSLESAIVDTSTGRATAATLIGNVTYLLTELGPNDPPKVVTSGTARAAASYDRYPQRFATVRAARDAETRVAREIAEQIRTRIAASFAGQG